MKIVSAEVIVCCPGRNFVTLKITTDEGLTGVGDGTLKVERALRARLIALGEVDPPLNLKPLRKTR